jgi:hypothetical protein
MSQESSDPQRSTVGVDGRKSGDKIGRNWFGKKESLEAVAANHCASPALDAWMRMIVRSAP